MGRGPYFAMAMDGRQGKLAQWHVRSPGGRCNDAGGVDGRRAATRSAVSQPIGRHSQGPRMPDVTSLDRFTVPLGGQEIELQQWVHDAGGMALLRIRVRERTRFTIFDVDPATARRWGEAMVRWADSQQGAVPADTPEDRHGRA